MSPVTYADLIVTNARIATLDDRRSEGTGAGCSGRALHRRRYRR